MKTWILERVCSWAGLTGKLRPSFMPPVAREYITKLRKKGY